MNKQRRKEIERIENRIEALRELVEEISVAIECVLDEERECLDNMPENLQCSERYEKAENAVENLESAYEMVSEFDIEELTTYLGNAREE